MITPRLWGQSPDHKGQRATGGPVSIARSRTIDFVALAFTLWGAMLCAWIVALIVYRSGHREQRHPFQPQRRSLLLG